MQRQSIGEAAAKVVAEAAPEGECLISFRTPAAKRPRVTVGGVQNLAAHVVWMAPNGPIPHGHELHHSCQRGRCVRLEHLVLLTQEAHIEEHRRLVREQVQRCVNDHPFDGEIASKPGWRKCLRCHAEAQRRYRAKRSS